MHIITYKVTYCQTYSKSAYQDRTRDKLGITSIIGKPITPEKIEGIEELGEILKRRKENPKSITKGDLVRARELQQALQAESNKVMASLAEMLPEEKRGPWAATGAEESEEKEASEKIIA